MEVIGPTEGEKNKEVRAESFFNGDRSSSFTAYIFTVECRVLIRPFRK